MSDVPQPGYVQGADGRWYPAQNAYGAPPGYGMAPAKTNGMAVASLVLGIIGILSCGPIFGIPAIILGGSAKKAIRASNGAEGGEGLATGGQITGWIATLLGLLAILAILAITFLGTSASSKFSSVASAIS